MRGIPLIPMPTSSTPARGTGVSTDGGPSPEAEADLTAYFSPEYVGGSFDTLSKAASIADSLRTSDSGTRLVERSSK